MTTPHFIGPVPPWLQRQQAQPLTKPMHEWAPPEDHALWSAIREAEEVGLIVRLIDEPPPDGPWNAVTLP